MECQLDEFVLHLRLLEDIAEVEVRVLLDRNLLVLRAGHRHTGLYVSSDLGVVVTLGVTHRDPTVHTGMLFVRRVDARHVELVQA